MTGACERSIACSTCHVILDPEVYDKLPEPEDEENDMLDLAFALEDTYVPLFPVLLLVPSPLQQDQQIISFRLRPTGLNTSICARCNTNGRSRLGCQVFLTKEVDGLVAKLPSATRNMYVDGESSILYIPSRLSLSLFDSVLGGHYEFRETGEGDGEIKKRSLMNRRQG